MAFQDELENAVYTAFETHYRSTMEEAIAELDSDQQEEIISNAETNWTNMAEIVSAIYDAVQNNVKMTARVVWDYSVHGGSGEINLSRLIPANSICWKSYYHVIDSVVGLGPTRVDIVVGSAVSPKATITSNILSSGLFNASDTPYMGNHDDTAANTELVSTNSNIAISFAAPVSAGKIAIFLEYVISAA